MGAQKAEPVDTQTTLVVGTLERTAAETVRRVVLKRALDSAELDAIPHRVEDLTFFVSGPLYEAAYNVLGEDYADDLLLELAPVLDRAWQDDRASVVPPSRDQPTLDEIEALDEDDDSEGEDTSPQVRSRLGTAPSYVPTSKVRKKSSIQRVEVDLRSRPASGEAESREDEPEDVAGERSDTVPAPGDRGQGGAHRPDTLSSGLVTDTIPGNSSAPPPPPSLPEGLPEASSSRGGSIDSDGSGPESWEQTDPPPSSDPTLANGRFAVPPAAIPRSLGPTAKAATFSSRAPSRDETPPPPRSHRFTVPYLEAVLTPPRRRRRIMIVDGRDGPRRDLGTALEKRGYAVITAHDRSVAITLFQRLHPTLVIADVETIAPDFAPLGPALDELTVSGDSEEGEAPRVLLLSDGVDRSLPPEIERVIEATSEVDSIVREVERLLPIESQRRI